MRRHEPMPYAIAIEKLGRQSSVIVGNKLDDVLKLCHRTVSNETRSFGVKRQYFPGRVQLAVIGPKVSHYRCNEGADKAIFLGIVPKSHDGITGSSSLAYGPKFAEGTHNFATCHFRWWLIGPKRELRFNTPLSDEFLKPKMLW